MFELEEIAGRLIEGEEDQTRDMVKQALDKGISASEILNNGLLAGMNEVGERFKQADMFIPEVLMSARAMQAGVAVLQPVLAQEKFENLGRVVLGTVKDDIHEIGKNLVGIMLSGAGFEVIDLGTNVPPEKFIEAAIEKKARIIAMSSLLTTTMNYMKDTIEQLKEAGLGGKIKTLVGGAVVTQRYADEIGADGYAPEAASAIARAREILAAG
jgi:5-methyltetrahydrofolate--homocysteine methyltransferase